MPRSKKVLYKPEHGKAALVIIDEQNVNCEPGDILYEDQYPAVDTVVTVIKKLITFFRDTKMPIIWIITYIPAEACLAWSRFFPLLGPPELLLAEGKESTKIYKEYQVWPEDITVIKHHMSAFWETDLGSKLRNLGIEYPCFVGHNTDECVEGSIRDACVRLFNSITVSDAVGTHNGKEAHEVGLWRLRRFSRVMTSEQLIAELS